ncbi:MAG: agmatine deiminase family protein [Verrucomicrobiales bacterium]|nr:agmatine deiminase family protein [Verrucomicrobiales bacterium]
MQDRLSSIFSKNSDVRIPAEFEPQESLVFGCGQLVRSYPQTFVDFVSLLYERIPLFGVAAPDIIQLGEILLGTAGLPKDAVTFLPLRTSSVWLRDYSPFSALDRQGNRFLLKFRHGNMKNRDDIGAYDAIHRNFRGVGRDVGITLEGGNLISNGAGLAISSKTIITQNSRSYDMDGIAQVLDKQCGIAQWACATPLNGERTGHIDMLATFLAPDLLAVAECDPREDPNNISILNGLAEAFEGFAVGAGQMRVVRVPMPFSGNGDYRSYNNAIFANGLFLVPTYPSLNPKMDRAVLEMYSEWLPGYEVKGLDCEELSLRGGSLHCITRNICPNRIARRRGSSLESENAQEILPR